MMVVVQSLSHGAEGKPLEVGRPVVVRPSTEMVTESIHSRIARQVQVRVCERPEEPDKGTEEHHQNGGAEEQSRVLVVEKKAVPSVIGHVARVPVENGGVTQGLSVQRHVLGLNRSPSEKNR